jgi:hypothetical protein
MPADTIETLAREIRSITEWLVIEITGEEHVSREWAGFDKRIREALARVPAQPCATCVEKDARIRQQSAAIDELRRVFAEEEDAKEATEQRADAAEQARAWQPIETAPKGQFVLVSFGQFSGAQMAVLKERGDSGEWIDEDEEMDPQGEYYTPPTHWQRLPAPPVSSETP